MQVQAFISRGHGDHEQKVHRPDVRAVDLLFMIAVPPGNESLHLQILARLVNLLSRNSLVDALRHASSPERFVELIAKTENACFAD